jgi:four helix bundle protein
MNDFIDKNLIDSSYKFALKIVKLVQIIQSEKKEYTMSKQLLRTGTSIGSLLTEIKFLEDKQEAIDKLSYALSDVYKTKYWMTLLLSANYINQTQHNSVLTDCKIIYEGLKAAADNLK